MRKRGRHPKIPDLPDTILDAFVYDEHKTMREIVHFVKENRHLNISQRQIERQVQRLCHEKGGLKKIGRARQTKYALQNPHTQDINVRNKYLRILRGMQPRIGIEYEGKFSPINKIGPSPTVPIDLTVPYKLACFIDFPSNTPQPTKSKIQRRFRSALPDLLRETLVGSLSRFICTVGLGVANDPMPPQNLESWFDRAKSTLTQDIVIVFSYQGKKFEPPWDTLLSKAKEKYERLAKHDLYLPDEPFLISQAIELAKSANSLLRKTQSNSS